MIHHQRQLQHLKDESRISKHSEYLVTGWKKGALFKFQNFVYFKGIPHRLNQEETSPIRDVNEGVAINLSTR